VGVFMVVVAFSVGAICYLLETSVVLGDFNEWVSEDITWL
jgi:hypothetical protein